MSPYIRISSPPQETSGYKKSRLLTRSARTVAAVLCGAPASVATWQNPYKRQLRNKRSAYKTRYFISDSLIRRIWFERFNVTRKYRYILQHPKDRFDASGLSQLQIIVKTRNTEKTVLAADQAACPTRRYGPRPPCVSCAAAPELARSPSGRCHRRLTRSLGSLGLEGTRERGDGSLTSQLLRAVRASCTMVCSVSTP